MAFFCVCFGEEANVDNGIVSYLINIFCELYTFDFQLTESCLLPAKCKKHVGECYENIDEDDEREKWI